MAQAERAELTPLEEALGVAIAYSEAGKRLLVHEARDLIERVKVAVLALPVEQRMEAMGLRCSTIDQEGEVLGYVVHTPEQAERWQREWSRLDAEWDATSSPDTRRATDQPDSRDVGPVGDVPTT